MEAVCYAVDKALLLAELANVHYLRSSNKGGNEIYTFTAHDAPNLMREVGRIRELAFRAAGGGTGKSCDIDEFDLREDNPCIQLIVWDPDAQVIMGGYRYQFCKSMPLDKDGIPEMAVSEIFTLSEKFIKDYLPYTIELGRSFVHPHYQSTQASRKSLYALDNLWDGLGALTVDNPEIKYFLGKVTMYRNFDILSRNMILYFMQRYFGDKEQLVTPKPEYELQIDLTGIEGMFASDNYTEDYKILSKQVREQGTNIPPLVNAYMGLSPTMKVFGTSLNPFFGDVEETGILITIEDVYEAKKMRHIETYQPCSES